MFSAVDILIEKARRLVLSDIFSYSLRIPEVIFANIEVLNNIHFYDYTYINF